MPDLPPPTYSGRSSTGIPITATLRALEPGGACAHFPQEVSRHSLYSCAKHAGIPLRTRSDPAGGWVVWVPGPGRTHAARVGTYLLSKSVDWPEVLRGAAFLDGDTLKEISNLQTTGAKFKLTIKLERLTLK